jgi:type I protein arginine methyltransferase
MRDVKKEHPAAPSSELPGILPEWAAAHSLHYQLLANQQLMLEDVHRTSKYHSGILENAADFAGKVVLDVGAGTGILSLFAAQAGAKKIYAVEGTSAATYARQLIEHAGLVDRIEVLRGRLDEIELPDKVEVIISEPWGFFLFHERMIEVFLSARDRFLVDGGRLFPSAAKAWLAPFRDDDLYEWRCEGIAFWQRTNFFGVDLSALADTARRELFGMPAVGLVDPASLVAEPVGYDLDLSKMDVNDLGVVELPFRFAVTKAGVVHGLAGWFDVFFAGSCSRVTLSTAPQSPPTHWAQVRFLFSTPIELELGQILTGVMTLTANAESSYDVSVEFAVEQQARVHRQHYRLQAYFSWQGDG